MLGSRSGPHSARARSRSCWAPTRCTIAARLRRWAAFSSTPSQSTASCTETCPASESRRARKTDVQREMIERYIAQAGGYPVFARQLEAKREAQKLLADRALVERVARANDLSVARFQSQELGRQVEMVRAYQRAESAGCPPATAGQAGALCSR